VNKVENIGRSCYTLQWTGWCPPKYSFLWGIWAPSNAWFLGHTRVDTPNGTSISSVVFVGCTVVSNGQTYRQINTDHAASVAVGCIFALCACKQPKNWLQWIQAWGQGCHRRVLGKISGGPESQHLGLGYNPVHSQRSCWGGHGRDWIGFKVGLRLDSLEWAWRLLDTKRLDVLKYVNGNKILRINRKTLIDQNIEGALGFLA